MPRKLSKIGLISADKVGKSMAGMGIRYFEMAKAFSRHFPTTLLVPDSCDLSSPDFKIVKYDSRHASSSIRGKIKGCDYVMANSLRPNLLKTLKNRKIVYLADLYDPITIETLEYHKYEKISRRKATFNCLQASFNLQLYFADHIICASNRQEDLYLGMLTNLASPGLKNKISIVPFGLSREKPIFTDPKVLEKKFPIIKPTDKIIYWGGGIWNWFDPLTLVKAIEKISKKRQDIKLFFLGTKHPDPKIKEMEIAQKTLEYCRKKKLLDKFVFFNYGWTPFRERVNYLLRATIGVSTHFDNLETRFSFRTRVLDYIWGELPLVVTEGDSMADLTKQYDLGKVVPFKNINALATAILEIVDHPSRQKEYKKNLRLIKDKFYWDKVILPIVKLIKNNKLESRPVSTFTFNKLALKCYWADFQNKILK